MQSIQGSEEIPMKSVSEPTGATVVSNVALQAQFDCLLVNDNEAAMSGTITSSNNAAYTVGQAVTLFVVDKVDGVTPPVDAFSWAEECGEEGCPPPPTCFYDGVTHCEGESCTSTPGAALTWTAADAELYPCTLPEGYPNVPPVCPEPDPNGSTTGIPAIPTAVSCASFPLSAYPLTLVQRGHGNKIQVKNNP